MQLAKLTTCFLIVLLRQRENVCSAVQLGHRQFRLDAPTDLLSSIFLCHPKMSRITWLIRFAVFSQKPLLYASSLGKHQFLRALKGQNWVLQSSYAHRESQAVPQNLLRQWTPATPLRRGSASPSFSQSLLCLPVK